MSVAVTGSQADISTPNPPATLSRLPTDAVVRYQFDAAEFVVTLNQGTIAVSGAANQVIDLTTAPVVGVAPVGTFGSLTLTPAGQVGSVAQFDALLELPLMFTQQVESNGQLITLEVDGDIVAMSQLAIDLGGFSADFNSDGSVDAADLTQWQANYGGPGSDADGDGDSDGADFLAWQQQFGSGLDPTLQAIPEPSGLVLGVLGGLGWYSRRNRRKNISG